MRSRVDFLKGLITGATAGIGIAVLLRTGFARSISAALQKSPPNRASGWNSEYPQRARDLILRRELPERGGNPASLSPEKSDDLTTSFERPSGAPGSPAGAEHIGVPGRPGETSDYSDSSQGVRPAGRAIHVPDPRSDRS